MTYSPDTVISQIKDYENVMETFDPKYQPNQKAE